jgi:catechol 2,3-dioxygenase
MPELKAAPYTRPAETHDDIIRPTLHHVFLKTNHSAEMKRWWYTVVGMSINFEFPGDGGAFLSNDEAHHRVVLFQTESVQSDPEKVGRAGLHHIGFEYQSLDDLLSTYTRLKGLGILPAFTVAHGTTTSFYYVDPDENLVELQVDPFLDWDKSTTYMRESEDFRADPSGPPIDPEALIAARQQGVSEYDVQQLARAGEYPAQVPQTYYLPDEPTPDQVAGTMGFS